MLDILKACGFTEDRFFIHCDGALFGMMMPFLRKDAPMVTFKKPIGRWVLWKCIREQASEIKC